MGGGNACEHRRWGLRWSSLWGHETCEGCAELGAVGACERSHLGLRWSSLWGHETCEGCAEMGAVGKGKDEEEGGGEGAPSLQNEDPTPQDGWENYPGEGPNHMQLRVPQSRFDE